MKLKRYTKRIRFKSLGGIDTTPEVMALINSYAYSDLAPADVYVRKWYLANNGIDRDNERFPESLLAEFAATLPGKSFLKSHNRKSLPIGLFFNSEVQVMSPEQYKTATGEEIRLPENIADVHVLVAWPYILQRDYEAETIDKLNAGIYRHVSVGFGAADLVPVRKEVNGPALYWEYMSPGEATEGSLVWLGAQTGATVQKSLFADDDAAGGETKTKNKSKEGKGKMDELMKRLQAAMGKTFGSADDLVVELSQMVKAMEGIKAAKAAADAEIVELKKKAAGLEDKVKGLEPLAAEGQAYRADLVDRYAKAKAALGECDESPDAVKAMKGFASGFDVEFLRSEVKHLEDRVAEKFPAESQTQGGEPEQDKRTEAEKKAAGNKGDEDNPFIPDSKEAE